MRKLLILGGLLAGFALAGPNWAFAADPVFLAAYPESNYTISQSTVQISSSTVVTIADTSDRFREVYIGDPDSVAKVFYRIDGDNTNVAAVGWWIPAGEGQKIETNNAIYAILEADGVTDDFRVVIITK